MKYQAILLISIIAISSFFIKVDAGKKQNFAEFIKIEAPENARNNSDSYINVSNPVAEPINVNCPLIGARIASMRYLNQGKDIFEINADDHWPIASISKLMSAVIAFEEIGENKEIIISSSSIAAEGSAGNFKEEELFKAFDLIKSMLVVSSNDAAEALAESIGRENFINLMNKKAEKMGMLETNFASPSGFSLLNQSTAGDLIKLVDYIYSRHPKILQISREKQVEIIELNSNKKRILLNINEFAGNPDFWGGKTGYLDESGRNLAALFKRNNQPLLIIILGAENAFDEAKKLLQCIDNDFQIVDSEL